MDSEELVDFVDNQPSYFKTFIGKYVSLLTKEHSNFRGFVDAIDPITGSVILSTVVKNELQVNVVIGYNVRKIVLEEAPIEHKYKSIEDELCDEPLKIEDIHKIKREVHNWLVRNLLPVKEVEDKLDVHDGQVVISPPYRPDDCTSSNTIVLGRIQHLLQNMPKHSD